MKESITNHLDVCDSFLKAQPPASDLDNCDRFLRNLNALYARNSELFVQSQAIYAKKSIEAIEGDLDGYKQVKNSSTLATIWLDGKIGDIAEFTNQLKQMNQVLKLAAENYRTLISSYRQEREFELRTHVRTTRKAG